MQSMELFFLGSLKDFNHLLTSTACLSVFSSQPYSLLSKQVRVVLRTHASELPVLNVRTDGRSDVAVVHWTSRCDISRLTVLTRNFEWGSIAEHH